MITPEEGGRGGRPSTRDINQKHIVAWKDRFTVSGLFLVVPPGRSRRKLRVGVRGNDCIFHRCHIYLSCLVRIED